MGDILPSGEDHVGQASGPCGRHFSPLYHTTLLDNFFCERLVPKFTSVQFRFKMTAVNLINGPRSNVCYWAKDMAVIII